jgi:hypothetical protein
VSDGRQASAGGKQFHAKHMSMVSESAMWRAGMCWHFCQLNQKWPADRLTNQKKLLPF